MRLHHLHRRQGPGATGQPARHAGQHHEQRNARRGRRAGQVRRAAGAHRRLPDAGRRHAWTTCPASPRSARRPPSNGWTQYGSLDDIVAHADDIGGAVGENLRQHLDFLPLGRKLVTVACDLELPARSTDLAPPAADTDAADGAVRPAGIQELAARTRRGRRRRDRAMIRRRCDSGGRRTRSATTTTILAEASLAHWLDKLEAAPN